MAIRDTDIDLLQLAAEAATGWQNTARQAGVTIQQMVLEFPPAGESNPVQLTWREAAPAKEATEDQPAQEAQPAGFDIATLTPVGGRSVSVT